MIHWGVKRYPINNRAEKEKWKQLEYKLDKARAGKTLDVLDVVVSSKLIPISPEIEGYYSLYKTAPDTLCTSDVTVENFLNLEYKQFLAAINFLYPESEFSTEHGIKGEEYDNVIFAICKGWNQYQFDVYVPMMNGRVQIPSDKEASYERNRNLFYIRCSRSRKRLFLFISIPLESEFKKFLIDMVGIDNIYTLSQYLEQKV